MSWAQNGSKPCDECTTWPALKGRRYCEVCQARVLKRMREDGYLSNARGGTFSDQRGRRGRDTHTAAGSAEFLSDGDDQ